MRGSGEGAGGTGGRGCRLSRRGGLWLWVQGPQALPGTSLSHPQHLHELLVLQVPLLDAVVPGATEQDVPLDGQTLDAVVVRGLEVVGGPDGARHALTQLEHLQKKGWRESRATPPTLAATSAPGDLPNPGIKPGSSALQVDSSATELPGKSKSQLITI